MNLGKTPDLLFSQRKKVIDAAILWNTGGGGHGGRRRRRIAVLRWDSQMTGPVRPTAMCPAVKMYYGAECFISNAIQLLGETKHAISDSHTLSLATFVMMILIRTRLYPAPKMRCSRKTTDKHANCLSRTGKKNSPFEPPVSLSASVRPSVRRTISIAEFQSIP